MISRGVSYLLALAMLGCGHQPTESDGERFVREALSALTSDQRDVRASARAALGGMGRELLQHLPLKLPTQADEVFWRRLEEALRRTTESPDVVVQSLRRHQLQWPKEHSDALNRLVARLSWSDERSGVVSLLDAFEKATEFWDDDPRIDKIVDQGRSAIPYLLSALRFGSYRRGFADEAAALALSRILAPGDIDIVAQLLRDGHLIAAPALRGIHSQEARDALLHPLRRGLVNHHLIDELDQYAKEVKVREATLSRLKEGVSEEAVVIMAAFCARHGYYEAVPLLTPTISRGARPSILVPVAIALCRLGDRDAIDVLLQAFRGDTQVVNDVWRFRAGEALNWIVGRSVFRGSESASKGNFLSASQELASWWDKQKDMGRFDKTRRTWVWD